MFGRTVKWLMLMMILWKTSEISKLKWRPLPPRQCQIPRNSRVRPCHRPRLFIQKIIAELLLSVCPQELVIHRAQRLPKQSFVPEWVPRDVIARIYYYHVKDQLIQFACRRNSLPEPYVGITLYTVLSQATIQALKNVIAVTKILWNNNNSYKWKFPTKLSIKRNNKSHIVANLDEGLDLLRIWDLFPEDISDSPFQQRWSAPWRTSPNTWHP